MAGVKLREITKKFGSNQVIHTCDIEVTDKEFLVLVGPSGCGKSTLLRIIAGLEEATTGLIHIGGKDVSNLPPKDRDIAMVFQNYALYPHMNVAANMGFGLKMRGYKKADIQTRVSEAAKVLEIEQLLDRRPAQLSGGQRQRVAMGRAIVRKPAVFLFDEPLSNLDAKLRIQMRLEIKKLHERISTTVVYVTHDQVEAMTLADRIAVINEGRIMQHATPDEIYNRPANRFVAEFIGAPPMNFIKVDFQSEGENIAAVAEGLEILLPARTKKALGSAVGKGAILGIRPENLNTSRISPKDAAINATVDVVEPLGPNTVLFCKMGYSTISATVPADAKFKAGQGAELYLNPDQVKLFDTDTGDNLID